MNPTQVRAPLRAPAEVSLRRTRLGDAGGLTEMLAGLSVTSSYLRFFTGLRRPSPRLVDRLLRRDATHGAWLAMIGDSPVGHVMWAIADEAVELGVVVTDAWQQRGIGRWLIQAALAEAAVAGATAVHLDVHVDNRRVVGMLRRSLPDALVTREAEMLTYRAPMTSAVPAHAPRRATMHQPA
jgi:GNAT superfamily N-acetyltransferase